MLDGLIVFVIIYLLILLKELFMKQSSIGISVLVSLLFATFIGCGGGSSVVKTEPVSGVVTFKGEPLPGATLCFAPAAGGEGLSAYARTNDKGEYKLQTPTGAANAGTTPGEYKVTIKCSKLVSTGKQEMSDSEGKMVDIMESVDVIPKKYGNAKQTPFKVTIAAGENKHDFKVD